MEVVGGSFEVEGDGDVAPDFSWTKASSRAARYFSGDSAMERIAQSTARSSSRKTWRGYVRESFPDDEGSTLQAFARRADCRSRKSTRVRRCSPSVPPAQRAAPSAILTNFSVIRSLCPIVRYLSRSTSLSAGRRDRLHPAAILERTGRSDMTRFLPESSGKSARWSHEEDVISPSSVGRRRCDRKHVDASAR